MLLYRFFYPKLKFILCIDSLHFSNVDEVNCIWLDIIILYVVHGYNINTYLLGCICVAKATINQVNKFHLVNGNIMIQ